MDEKNRLRQIKELRQAIGEPGVSLSIAGHLAQLDKTTSLAKAGYLLRKLGTDDWNAAGDADFKPVRLGIISNFVCDEIQHYLRTLCLAEAICPELYVAEYNQYMWQLLDNNSELYGFSPDIALCLLDEHLFFEQLPADWMAVDFENCIEAVLNGLLQAFSSFFKNSSALLVVNTIALSAVSYNTAVDYRSKMKLSRLIREFNQRLLTFMEDHKTGLVIDTDILLQTAATGLTDIKMSAYAKMHFAEPLLAAIAREIKKIARSSLGKTRKCLVLDCDNTLWGGVVGDAGVDGIVLGGSPEGEAYGRFQAVVRQLGKQGVILTLNSKNDRENTDAVFDGHPDAVLKQADFSEQCVNWLPKHENIHTLSERLNIGIDHMVFVDDSEFECNMVREFLPDVTVLKLSGNPEEYVQQVLEQGWFNTRELTEEDFSRGDKYRAESERKLAQSKYQSVEEYLHSLEIKVELFFADEFSIPRIAQITQRTNQFNLTTERLGEQQVGDLSDSDNWLVIGFKAEDKFGCSGIVGAVLIEQVDDERGLVNFHIRNFLMSCRVFSRGIETAVVAKIAELARRQSVADIYGYFSPSAKNGKYKDFYLQHGFEETGENSDKGVFRLHSSSGDKILKLVPWININNLSEIEESYCA